MVSWYQILRIEASLIAYSFTVLIIFLGTDHRIDTGAILALPIFLMTMSGFIINDIFDIERDRNRLDKPIANKLISLRTAIGASSFLVVGAIIMIYFLGSFYSFLTIVLAIIALIAYTPIIHRIPIIKGLYTSILCCTPLIYGTTFINHYIPFIMYATLILFIVGRELIIDVKDYKSDNKFGLKTIPAYIGVSASIILGWSLMGAGIILLLIYSTNLISSILGFCTLLSFLLILWLFLKNYEEMALRLSRIVLFLGAIAISTTTMN